MTFFVRQRRWWVIAVAVYLLVSVQAAQAGSYRTTLSEALVTTTGTPVSWRELTMYIAPQTFQRETTLTLRQWSPSDPAIGLPQLPATQAQRSDMYYYRFNRPLSTELTVRINFDFTDSDVHKKQIWLFSPADHQWRRVRTTMNKANGYVQARLTERDGYLVVTSDRRHVEAPMKHTWFSPYPGTPLSDTAAVMDVKSGKWLYREQATKPRHIASITKLMTVAIFLQSNPNLEEIISYQSNADRIGAAVILQPGDQLRLRDVLMSTLMPSANNMAVTLVQHSGLGWTEFIERMNTQAAAWHLGRTHFTDPTGLDVTDVSTAGNVARLARRLFMAYPDYFLAAADQSIYSFTLSDSGRQISVESTNKFNGHGVYRALAFKTGYYPGSAERTLVIEIEEIATGHKIIVVLLGDPQYDTINAEAEDLAAWTFANWDFHNY